MIIGKHAVRRYKQRIGKKNATKERVVRDIKKQIEKHWTNKYQVNKEGYYRIVTPKFVAVCYKNRVVTILDKEVG